MKTWTPWAAALVGLVSLIGCAFENDFDRFKNGTSSGSTDAGPTLSLLAGSLGGPGYTDGAGTSARFASPYAVTSDNAGILYVGDNQMIRKVEVASGTVTTLAGSAGAIGNMDGIGTAARFNGPNGIATDGVGNLYVADSLNHTIRKIVISTGQVTTLAGLAGTSGVQDGIGSSARFTRPFRLTADGAGNIFVADSGNNTIRKIVLATGAVTTVAGLAGTPGYQDGTGSSALFRDPRGIAADRAGNLFVAEASNNTIRKIVISTATVSTLAGSALQSGYTDGVGAVARFNNPYGLTIDAAGSNLYVADTHNHTVRKVVISTQAVSTLAGSHGVNGSTDATGANARFNDPTDIATDGVANLNVADDFNTAIRKVVISAGAVTTVSGSPASFGSADGTGSGARFSLPRFAATDGAGNLYVADNFNHTIRKVVVSTGAVTTLAGAAGVAGSSDSIDNTGSSARFNFPYGVAADGSGNLYVTDSSNHTIRKIVLSIGAVTTLAGSAGMPGWADGISSAGRFAYPRGIATDGAGNLYVADESNQAIRRIVISTGAVTTLAGSIGVAGHTDGTGPAAQFNHPVGITADASGYLYVTDNFNHTVRKVEVSTGVVTTLAGVATIPGSVDGIGSGALLNSPQGVALDGIGNLYVADFGNNTVRRIALSNGAVTTWMGLPGRGQIILGPLPAGLNGPIGLVALPAGEVVVVDQAEGTLLLVR